ncbi:heat-inducible transcriptional repressor HrcA [Acidiferrimicrobium sp. IK]|uniref:heat-inducible transcriptional repressor HrcA n=1 Tax=Acidiferrimicrobium sp. IK TaxID=2871700 RepID=UPI0021CB876F|nr:heat-inducible transcriptional repressor HrcA [Acidiferrimicrobium sp. IK]MCU4187315.1 heat-inducible transcriptional repressor HrcA [Acidiferrimicrobium sp. IK]
MLDDRKSSILRAVVEEYIRTAQPVGSAHVAERAGLPVSSATIRNEMSALERDGYLVQPHTSAGRIPTDRGYRFFVDHLAPKGQLQPAQSQQVRTFFSSTHGELERMLADTSRLLSALTDYAAVVVGPSHELAYVRSVQLVGLGGRVALAVVVLSNGTVEKRSIEMVEETNDVTLSAASVHLTKSLTGTVWGAPAPVAPTGDLAVDGLVARAIGSFGADDAQGGTDNVFVGGASRMAVAFDAVETIRQVLGILEQQVVVVGLISDILDRGLSVSIGAEHGVPSLADCSVIVAPYDVEGERAGSIGILGPTRMDYQQALAAVAVVSKRLGRALSEGA